MKRLLACITTACVLCVPVISSWADEVDSSGRVRLSDDNSTPPPIPHVIGSDEDSGRAVLNGMGDGLPQSSPVYQETFNAPNLGYRMSGDVFTTQFRLDQRNGGLYGYDDGYANVGAFIPRALDENSLMFFDIRGLFTNNSDGGFNLGLGRRNYDAYGDRVYSQSIWLDYDGGHVNQYLQGGVSWAMTSRYWRTRVNVNRILSDQDDFIGTTFGSTPTFVGNQVNLARDRFREVAYNHADASIGGPIPLLGQFGMNWDFGLYYESSYRGQDGIGFMAHVDANLTEDLTMDVRYTNDDIFGTSSQLSFVYNFPDGRASRVMRQPRVHDYMLRPEERNYRVSTKQYTVSDSIPLLNSIDGSPITVAHVDPFEVDNVVASGDGSSENPFNSSEAWNNLSGAEKAEFDIVYVQPGVTPDGSFFTNNLNSGFNIVENQRLLASTGRIERRVGTNGNEILYRVPHQITAMAADTEYNSGLPSTFFLPSDIVAQDATMVDPLVFNVAGTPSTISTLQYQIFDPVNDVRPILTNDTPTDATQHYSVVTIDNSFSVNCESDTEVSGFIISGANPNMTTMLNSGIVTGDVLNNPNLALHGPGSMNNATGVNEFDINSNFIIDTVHGVNITHLGSGQGVVENNRIEGDGFNSNSGITIRQNSTTMTGELDLRVADNLVYNVFGEDINNNGVLDAFAMGTEDINGNGKLDIGEDLNGNGVIDVDEDNDKDGVLGADDLGIGINLIAEGAGNSIDSNSISADGTVNVIQRNVTHLSEAQYFRTQSLDNAGVVTNTFSAKDINGDIAVSGILVTPNSDTDDNIGNKNGMNIFANTDATFSANLINNETSFNNPYATGLLPTVKNPFLSVAPAPLGNEFGLRTAADNGATLTLASPNSHLSNNNLGHGYILEALNGGTVNMTSPMMGSFTTDPITGLINSVTPSQYNNNGLNGLFVNGANGGNITINVGPSGTMFDGQFLNQFNQNGQDPTMGQPGNGILFSMDNSTLSGGIFHNQIDNNLENGIAFNLINGTSADDFMITNNSLANNIQHGITMTLEDTPIDGWVIANNLQTGNGGLGAGSSSFLYRVSSSADLGTIQNTSQAGFDLLTFDLDLSTVGVLYDTIEPGASSPFRPFFGDDVTTGLATVNGTPIIPGTFPLQDTNMNVLADGGVPDNSTMLNLTFTDFNPNEIFQYIVDTDNVPDIASVPSGNETIGATVTATFTGGTTITGTLGADPLNPFGALFATQSGTPTPSEFDGINVNATNSNISNAEITGNFITSNGDNGIEFNLVNSNIGTVLIENNTITNNIGDGIQILNPDFNTNGFTDNSIRYSLNTINGNGGYGINMALDNDNVLDAVICNNEISNNTLGGINVVLQDDAIYRNGLVTGPNPTDETSFFFGNTVNNNGGIGYHIDAQDNSNFTLVASQATASTVSGNQDAGIGIEMSNNSTGTIRLDNITLNDTLDDDNGTLGVDDTNFEGDGFGLVMTDNAVLTELRIGHSTLDNTTASNNFGSGIAIDITDQTRIIDGADADMFGTLIQNVEANNNGNGNPNVGMVNVDGVGDGVSIVRRAESQLDPVWIRSSIFNENAGDGIDIQAYGGANDFLAPPATFTQNILIGGTGVDDGNVINNNGINGIDLLSSGDAILNVNIFNNEIDTTGTGDGIEGNTEFFGMLMGTWQGNTISNAAVDGISITAEDSQGGFGDPAAVMLTIAENTIDMSGRDGIRINSTTTDGDNDDDVIIAINDNIITNSGEDGVTILADLLGEVRITNFDRNEISLSGEDGLHIEAIDAGDIIVDQAISNRIRNNQGDGVDLFREGVGTLLVGRLDGLNSLIDGDTSGFVDNNVSFNGENGYRIFNSENGFLAARIAGRTTIDPTLNNGATATSVISNNGSNGIRVENNAGSINTGNDLHVQLVRNSVIGNGVDNTITEDNERNGLLLLAGTSSFGETSADIRQNYLSGNQNVDVLISTFVATPDPGTAGFQGGNSFSSLSNPDPLARLYLRFEDNRGNQLDVMRDANNDPTVTGYGQAYYNNPDALKSPERFYNAPNTQGISRRRNATRTTLDLIDFDSGNVLAGPPAPANNSFASNLPNIGGTGNDYDGGIIGVNDYPTGARRQVTNTAVNMGNIVLTYAPTLGPLAAGTPFTVSWIDLAGLGESTLVLDDGGGAYDMALSGAIAGGNVFDSVISDFNDTGFIDPINISDSFKVQADVDGMGGNDITGNYRWRTINVPTAFDLQPPQVPGTPFYIPGTDPFPVQPVIFP